MYDYSKPYKNIKGSFIRQINVLASQKDYISFAGGLPNNDLFPKNALMHIFRNYSTNLPSNIFQYAPTAGLPQLIELIKKQFELKENIIITSGAQQALDLVSAIFLNPKDKILVEEPTYLGATGVFKSYGAKCHSVKLTEDGIDLKQLKKKLQKNKYKFFYVIPNFQNPSSITYSKKKRKHLAKLAIKYNLIIIEDDPYAYLHFKNKQNPKIYDYAPNNTIYLASFSKILIPSLRVGYVMANNELLAKINISKQYKDLHTNLFSQYILYEYLKEFDIFDHIKTLQKFYESKAKLFYRTLVNELGDKLDIYKPKGGMFIWAKIKDGTDSYKLFEKAKEKKVLYVPGIMFCEDKSNISYIRFNFTNSTNEEIKEGIKRLKEVLATKL